MSSGGQIRGNGDEDDDKVGEDRGDINEDASHVGSKPRPDDGQMKQAANDPTRPQRFEPDEDSMSSTEEIEALSPQDPPIAAFLTSTLEEEERGGGNQQQNVFNEILQDPRGVETQLNFLGSKGTGGEPNDFQEFLSSIQNDPIPVASKVGNERSQQAGVQQQNELSPPQHLGPVLVNALQEARFPLCQASYPQQRNPSPGVDQNNLEQSWRPAVQDMILQVDISRLQTSGRTAGVGSVAGLDSNVATRRGDEADDSTNHSNGHPVPLFLAYDDQTLSEYQCLVRKQIDLFEAAPSDVESNAKGRNKQIVIGQVGIRCRHCSQLPPKQRATGAMYYPTKLNSIYQAAQGLATLHLCEHCRHIPPPLRKKLLVLREKKSSAGGGKKYWAEGAAVLGVYDDGSVLRFRTPPMPNRHKSM